MSHTVSFDYPSTTAENYGTAENLSYCLPTNLPEAIRAYWQLSPCMSLYSNQGITWASSFFSDRESALGLIHAMESLEDNWDGFGGAPILKATSSVAAGFVSSLPVQVPAPDVSANPNGTISLEWESNLGRAHLEIGKTRYSLYFRRYEGMSIFVDGFVNEIDRSKEGLLNEMFCLAAPQDYTINDIRLATAAWRT